MPFGERLLQEAPQDGSRLEPAISLNILDGPLPSLGLGFPNCTKRASVGQSSSESLCFSSLRRCGPHTRRGPHTEVMQALCSGRGWPRGPRATAKGRESHSLESPPWPYQGCPGRGSALQPQPPPKPTLSHLLIPSPRPLEDNFSHVQVGRVLAPCQGPQLVGAGLPQAERVGYSGTHLAKFLYGGWTTGLALPFPGCVILGKSLNLSEPRSPPLGIITAPTS